MEAVQTFVCHALVTVVKAVQCIVSTELVSVELSEENKGVIEPEQKKRMNLKVFWMAFMAFCGRNNEFKY
jgi:hypothetical protein